MADKQQAMSASYGGKAKGPGAVKRRQASHSQTTWVHSVHGRRPLMQVVWGQAAC